MKERLWHRLRVLVKLGSRSFLAGGRDVYETTRQSLVSVEARAGALTFTVLWLLSRLQSAPLSPYPFDPGPAFARLLEDEWVSLDAFRLLVLLLFPAAGAVLGIFIRHAWDLAETFTPLPPRRGAAWPGRFRAGLSAGAVLIMHGGFLMSGLRAHPALYNSAFHDHGFLGRLVQDWLAPSFLGRLWTLTAVLVLVAGAVQMGIRFLRWVLSFPVTTRIASGVLGAGTFFFLLGLWGVFRFHRPANAGPNIVVLAVEGLTSRDLEDATRAPALYALARRGRTFASCVPTVAGREASLMTLLTGRSPLSHGVRHSFPAGGDAVLGADSLPGQLRQAGFTTAAAADAGGDLLGRLAVGPSPVLDRVRAPDLSAAGIDRRDVLRRSVHLLPYLSGRLARRLLPPLRAVPELSDPRLLAGEGEGLLKQLRFRPRFFLLLYFSGGSVPQADRATGRVLRALDALDLDDSTWVALWSPFVSTEGNVSAPERFESPLTLAGPLHRFSTRRVEAPIRDVDVAPTLLAAAGLPVPEAMEGVPLLDADFSGGRFSGGDVYAESGLWTSEDESPLPANLRLSYGPPRSWLEEDPEGAGRLRIRPAAEDAVLSYRHRLLQAGRERLVYRPSAGGVVFEYYDLSRDPEARVNLADTRPGAERVKELKERLFQELRREAGWRPQNDFWIPEALMRDKE